MRLYISMCFLIAILAVLNVNAQEVLYLWEDGAPGFEHLKDKPERAADWWVKDVHNPNLTVFEPENPKGVAALVLPGGGHRAIVYNSEGKKAAKYLNDLGITAFVLKYRLVREEGSVYNFQHVKQDAFRAMRKIRSLAETYKIDDDRIGVMAFSAGGEIASMLAFDEDTIDSKGPIDQLDARPSFLVQIYPGPLFVPDESIPANAPPAFLLASNNDVCCSDPLIKMLQLYRSASIPVEIHIFAKGDHAFNMGDRSSFATIRNWPKRLEEWFVDYNYFKQ